MDVAASNSPDIRPVGVDSRPEALALLFGHLDEDDRPGQVETLLEAVRSGAVSPQGFLGAYRRDRLVGVVLTQLQTGRTALVWPPRLVLGEPPDVAGMLLEAITELLVRHRIQVAQVQTECDARGDDDLLNAHGYHHLADLLYLVAAEDQFPARPPHSPLEYEPYDVNNHRRLLGIVEATYQRTLDCPQLDGVREIEDVLAGYRATGVFDPQRWTIVRHRGADIGCLLLADHPDHGNWELVYMGVAPQQRGHGWGMDIARHAQWLTRQAGRQRLVLAVDAANEPAIRVYAAVGFRAWERRRVLVKLLAAQP